MQPVASTEKPTRLYYLDWLQVLAVMGGSFVISLGLYELLIRHINPVRISA